MLKDGSYTPHDATGYQITLGVDNAVTIACCDRHARNLSALQLPKNATCVGCARRHAAIQMISYQGNYHKHTVCHDCFNAVLKTVLKLIADPMIDAIEMEIAYTDPAS